MARPPRRTTEKPPSSKSPRVEVRKGPEGLQLLIDGVPQRHGVFDDGMFFLHDYAYDPAGDLEELGHRFVAYRQRVEARRAERTKGLD